MNFAKAYEALKQGTDIKRTHWKGFWRKENGTIVMLGEDRLSGAVYTCGDLAGLRAAMEKGEDPAPYLTCLTVCTFPVGTDEAVQELTLESAASKD